MYLDDFKARFWMWGPFAGFALAVLVVFIFLVPALFDLEEGGADQQYPYGTPYQLTLPGELRQAYLAANGGEASLKDLQSLRSSGVLENGDQRISFTSIKKRPWQSLLNLRFHTHELSFVVDGDAVWQRVTPRGRSPIVELKEGQEAIQIRRLGAFFDPLMMLFLLDEGRLLAVEEGQWRDRPAIVVRFENADLELKSTAYVDPSTMHQLARVDVASDGGQRTLHYSDHRKVFGLIEPFTIETRVDGELDNRIKVERIEHNIGTFPSSFSYPGDLNSG